MDGKPVVDVLPNSLEFETKAKITPAGFREYDARWLFPEQINLLGMQTLGLGLGTYFRELGIAPQIVVGHDYRSYSLSIKQALTVGLMASGAQVHDIGLALSPVAYFAQFELDLPAVAMVTASHNENGWTGVKMGAARPLTFGPDEMRRLKDIVLNGQGKTHGGGSYSFVPDMRERYIADLTQREPFRRRLKAVIACGNGTAGAFAPQVLSRLGVDVIPLHCELDYTFPHYNPNPEDMAMLHDLAEKVKETGADIGLAFDGDGDRCGVVDNVGHEIFADKIGVMLARHLSGRMKKARFVVDVKSTGLFHSDPVLQSRNAMVEYWKTGHSYIKRRSHETGALAGFEKSGHFFFNAPLGRGYDDGLAAAIAVLDLLDANPNKSIAQLYQELPQTWGSPTMSPYCPDENKYHIVAQVSVYFEQLHTNGGKVAGAYIRDLVTVNGVRIMLEDGTWGLVRASSNKPCLVVVVESPVSEQRMRDMFQAVDSVLRQYPEVGDYDQKL
jgi:phosphomannomutase/phosphoglucomutase